MYVRKPLIFASDEVVLDLSPVHPPAPSELHMVGKTPKTEVSLPVPELFGPPVFGSSPNDVPLAAKPIAGITAELIDRELDLKAALIERSKLRTVTDTEIDELLYELHKLLAGVGREGHFTPFLREGLGWTDKRPDKRARRLIARHKFRMGFMTRDEYRAILGNRRGSGASRPASEAVPAFGSEPRDEVANRVGTTVGFTFEVEEDESAAELEQASVSDAEATLATATFGRLETEAPAVMLQRRILLPAAEMDWLKAGLNVQKRRYGTANYTELLWKLALCGPKVAEPGDEWGETHDEILRDVGRNPQLAHRPDPDYDCAEDDD